MAEKNLGGVLESSSVRFWSWWVKKMAKQKPKHKLKDGGVNRNPFAGTARPKPFIDFNPRPKVANEDTAGLKKVILAAGKPRRPKPPPKRKPSIPEIAVQNAVKTFSRFLINR